MTTKRTHVINVELLTCKYTSTDTVFIVVYKDPNVQLRFIRHIYCTRTHTIKIANKDLSILSKKENLDAIVKSDFSLLLLESDTVPALIKNRYGDCDLVTEDTLWHTVEETEIPDLTQTRRKF